MEWMEPRNARKTSRLQLHTDRHRRTDTRPWSILWPDGDLTAQQLLAVWCFTLRITFHFQTPQPIRGRQGRQWQRDATLALLILRHAAPPNRHYQAYPTNTPLASLKTQPVSLTILKDVCILNHSVKKGNSYLQVCKPNPYTLRAHITHC